jgi:4-oxalocrotonate tautomerase
MPIIQITLIQGREAAAVSECAREVARTVHRSLGAPMESIRVLVNEIPASHWAVGDRTRDEIDAARSLVKEGAP